MGYVQDLARLLLNVLSFGWVFQPGAVARHCAGALFHAVPAGAVAVGFTASTPTPKTFASAWMRELLEVLELLKGGACRECGHMWTMPTAICSI